MYICSPWPIKSVKLKSNGGLTREVPTCTRSALVRPPRQASCGRLTAPETLGPATAPVRTPSFERLLLSTRRPPPSLGGKHSSFLVLPGCPLLALMQHAACGEACLATHARLGGDPSPTTRGGLQLCQEACPRCWETLSVCLFQRLSVLICHAR